MSASNPLPDPAIADTVERLAPSVLGIGSWRRGHASACLWRSGFAVTSASALWRAGEVTLHGAHGEERRGQVRGIDAGTDLALVAVDGGEQAPVPERAPATAVPRAGDFVFAVGREPGGLVHASFGRVGAAGAAWRSWRGAAIDRLIRLDGGLYPGLAGAPVADAAGRVIGIASAAFSRHHGVVLPLATVDRVVEALATHGRVKRGHLGVAAQPVALAPAQRSALGTAAETGLLVSGLADDGPAARAGVLVGDILVALGGQSVADLEALRALLAAEPVGARLTLQLLRGGQPLEIVVEVGEPPSRHCH